VTTSDNKIYKAAQDKHMAKANNFFYLLLFVRQ